MLTRTAATLATLFLLAPAAFAGDAVERAQPLAQADADRVVRVVQLAPGARADFQRNLRGAAITRGLSASPDAQPVSQGGAAVSR